MTAPSPEQVKAGIAALFDAGAGEYDQHGVEFFGPVGRWLVDGVAPQPGEAVLDLACGRGASLLPAAEAVGATGRVLGVDLAAGMVQALRAEAAARGLAHVEVRVGDAEAPPPGPYDVVLCSLGVFFLPEPLGAVRAWRTSMVPGGRLGVTAFGAPDPHWDAAYEELRGYLGDPPYEAPALFADGAAQGLLRDAGFAAVTEDRRDWTVTFADLGQWWGWASATGLRGLLARVPDEDRTGVQAAMTGRLSDALSSEGDLVWRPELRRVTAVAP